MPIDQLSLVVAAFLNSLLAGFLFAFAVVVMPGIRKLDDVSFLRAFQAMDRIIQDNNPLFLFVWLGSAVSLIAATALGFGNADTLGRVALVGATAVHLLGIQLPTATINIPLNNRLQSLDLATLNDDQLAAAREEFEPRWLRWNTVRTVLSCLLSLVLVALAAL